MRNVAIIGGGMTALAIARRLSLENISVTLHEKEATPGGLAGSFKAGGYSIDKYYRHIFESHQQIMEVISDLGMKDLLVFQKARMGYYSGGKVWPLNSAMDLLRFTPLRVIDRVRVGLSGTGFLAAEDWTAFDEVGAADYLQRKCGNRGYEIFWKPLLVNKFGSYHKEISAAWLWDRMTSRLRSRVGKSSEQLGYLSGGFQLLADRLVGDIESRGGRVISGRAVKKIETGGGNGPLFQLDGQEKYEMCIVTTPVPYFLDIVSGLPDDYRARLEAIKYAHSVCLVLRLKAPLSDYYWINIGDTSAPFAVMVEHTNWVDSRDYNDEHIVYLSCYVSSESDKLWNSSDEVVFETGCRSLSGMFKNYNSAQIIGYNVFREKYTQPIYNIKYSGMMPAFQTPVKGLYLVNTSQFYPLSRCMNTSFMLADRFVREIGIAP